MDTPIETYIEPLPKNQNEKIKMYICFCTSGLLIISAIILITYALFENGFDNTIINLGDHLFASNNPNHDPDYAKTNSAALTILITTPGLLALALATYAILANTQCYLSTSSTYELLAAIKTLKLQNTILNIHKTNNLISLDELTLIQKRMAEEVSEFKKNAISNFIENNVHINAQDKDLADLESDIAMLDQYIVELIKYKKL